MRRDACERKYPAVMPVFQRDPSMNSDAADSQTVNRIASSLLEQTCRSESHQVSSAPLPSVSGTISIVQDIRDILFPGIYQARQPSAVSPLFEMQSLLNRVQSRLRVEIGRAMMHSRQAGIRVFQNPDQQNTATSPESESASAADLTVRFLERLPELRRQLSADITAAFDGDPAARTQDEILLCYPGILAVYVYRVAHELHTLRVPYLPRIMTEWAHRETGIDIHPGARIGESFFIDHGTGVVIGETCILGRNVTLYQGVTLGAWSFPRDEDGQLIRGTRRHPTLEDNVTVYSNATILGGTTVIGAGSQIGSSVSLNRSVPPNTIVTIERPLLRFREAA